MRIALLSSHLSDVGGVENYIRFMAGVLSRRGHELCLFHPTWSEHFAQASSRDAGLCTKILNLGSKPYQDSVLRPLSRLPYVEGLLKRAVFSIVANRVVEAVLEWKPDVVWQHDLSSSWLSSRVLSRTVPVVLTNHTGEYLLLRRLALSKIWLGALMSHYASVIGPSSELTPEFHHNAVTIHNGVDPSYFTRPTDSERSALRIQLLGAMHDRFVVFCPRRWAPTKGVIYLAKAIRRLNTRGVRDVIVVFAGSDYDLYPRYSAQIRALLSSCPDLVLEVGNLPVAAMRDWYQASDLVVIPSLMEAVSLAALEAMSCGVPVLSTNVGGMPEIIQHLKTGLLVSPADDEGLAAGILRAKRAPQVMADISSAALQFVRSGYSWDVVGARTAELLERTGRPSAP